MLVSTNLPQAMTAQIQRACATLGGSLVSQFTSQVTHVVCKPSEPAKQDETTPTKDKQFNTHRTLKTVLGILHGKWIVNIDWVTASLRANRWLSEEEFEIVGDTMHPFTFGPRRSRLLHDEYNNNNNNNNATPVFSQKPFRSH